MGYISSFSFSLFIFYFNAAQMFSKNLSCENKKLCWRAGVFRKFKTYAGQKTVLNIYFTSRRLYFFSARLCVPECARVCARVCTRVMIIIKLSDEVFGFRLVVCTIHLRSQNFPLGTLGTTRPGFD